MANRHLDRVLSPSYLDGLGEWPIEEIREHRTECQHLEDAASYLRRLVQTRIDILGMELRNRGTGENNQPVVDQLKALLSEPKENIFAAGRLMSTELRDDQESWANRRIIEACGGHDVEEIDDLNDSEVHDMTEALVVLEKSVSAERRVLHDVFDKLQAELIDRYKTGRATVDGLLR